MSPVSPQIHTLLTAAATAADAGHIEDASVLLQEALDHDFMADIAMALHALENEAATDLPFDLRPFIGQLVRIPPAREGTYETPVAEVDASDDTAADDDDFDFFGSELVVDVEELTAGSGNDTAPVPSMVEPADEVDDDISLLPLDDDDPLPPPETVPVPIQARTPSIESAPITEPTPLHSVDIDPTSNAFEEIDDLEELDALLSDDFTDSSHTDGDGDFSFDTDDAAPDVGERTSDDHGAAARPQAMADDPSAGMSVPGGRARYATSAPAPPPPSHRRSSTPTGDLSVPPETSSTDDEVSDPFAGSGYKSPRYRATSEASPVASMSHVTETDDDLDDFDLFGDSPASSPSTADAASTAPPPSTRQAPMPTLSGMASRVQEDTNPSGLATVANENQGPVSEFESPGISGVNSTIARGRGGLEKSDFSSGRQGHDTGSRRSIHGAGTYRAAGMSEDTGIKRRAAFRVTSTTVLKKRPLTRDQRRMLNPKSMFLYDQVDGLATVEDLIDISGLSMDEAMLVIEQLVHDNMVEVL